MVIKCENEESLLLSLAKQRIFAFKKLLKELDDNEGFACCPSCGYLTQKEEASFEICFICNWQDDGQGEDEADLVLGGPNKKLSLNKSRVLFEKKLFEYAQEVGEEINRNYIEILNKFMEENFLKNFNFTILLKKSPENLSVAEKAERKIMKLE